MSNLAVLHQNPGLIDIRSFTVMGINAKPNTKSPIGYFGTGLKYAVAVLVREGLKVTVWIGEDPYEFFAEKENFRGKDFLLIKMRRKRGATRRWFKEDLPFTTELGKNWKIWMALRELHSNTLDEGGSSKFVYAEKHAGVAGHTSILVEGEAYVKSFVDLDKIFLPGLERKLSGAHILVGQESQYAYYRGMRVLELQRPSINTYSVETQLTLTEDRTLSASYMWDYYVRHELMASSDPVLIRHVLQAPEDTYEHAISWLKDEYGYCTPEFLECVRLYGKKSTAVFLTHEREVKARTKVSWRAQLLAALELDDASVIIELVRQHKAELTAILNSTYSQATQAEDQRIMREAESLVEVGQPAEVGSLVDDIPF